MKMDLAGLGDSATPATDQSGFSWSGLFTGVSDLLQKVYVPYQQTKLQTQAQASTQNYNLQLAQIQADAAARAAQSIPANMPAIPGFNNFVSPQRSPVYSNLVPAQTSSVLPMVLIGGGLLVAVLLLTK